MPMMMMNNISRTIIRPLPPSFRAGIINVNLIGIRALSTESKDPPVKRPGFFRRIFFGAPKQPKESSDEHLNAVQKLRRKLSVAPLFEKLILDSKVTNDSDLAKLMSKSLAMGVYAFLGISILGTLGVDTKPLVAGVGITGFTIGFALKEVATNFISGVMLMVQKPFEKGSTLKIHGSGGGIEGIVESIDIRYVVLRLPSGGTVMVPSAIVYSNPITVIKPIGGQNPTQNIKQ